MSAPCDWDHESYCVEPGCRRPAAHRRLSGMVGDTPVVELVCCGHAAEGDDDWTNPVTGHGADCGCISCHMSQVQ